MVVEDGEEVSGAGSGDANFDRAVLLVFEDFGAGGAIGEDDSGFPDEGLVGAGDVFDEAVLFDDEAGEESFRHEGFVVVAQKEVVAWPGVGGGVGREQVGGDVVAGAAGDFVADFEFHHELEEFVVEVFVVGFVPDVGEVGAIELSEVLLVS